ncbi:MAG: hypothetical protein JO040_02230 [Gemmatimonadetes bacterium]|nr:hypothetical protein [Gemmatimonadota bacterium]
MSDNVLRLDSFGMRQMAEYSSGLRGGGGDPVYFVATPGPDPGDYTIKADTHEPGTNPEEVVVPCDTQFAAKSKRRRVKQIILVYESGDDDQVVSLDGTKYDAVFTSESAVEKFLFPYYASKYQWAAAEQLSCMSSTWYGFIPGLSAGDPPQPFVEEELPFAMAHYPRSDYSYVDPSLTVLTPGADVHVLRVPKSGGAVTPTALSKLGCQPTMVP